VASLGHAQVDGRIYRIGSATALSPASRQALAEEMSAFGWVRERDYVFLDSGVPMGPEIDEAARRIVAQKPDVIYVATTAYAVAVHRHTSTIPIVMYSSGYPVAAGVANSLARPGKNVTGNTVYAGTGVWGKLFQLLQELSPAIQRIGLLWTYLPPMFPREEVDFGMGDLLRDAKSLGVELHFAEVVRPEEAVPGVVALEAKHVDALLVTAGPQIWPVMQYVMQRTIAVGLPTIADVHWALPIEPMPLLTYGVLPQDLRRQAVDYIVRILKGAKPADLPIQQPARFELTVNLRTAKAIGLAVPPSTLLRANRVITVKGSSRRHDQRA
jgi:putative ABC transport system substrate-binding protein